MNPYNFRTIVDGDQNPSNYRMRTKTIDSSVLVTPVLETPDDGVWENEGGALAPEPYVVDVTVRNNYHMRLRGARKQRAAKMYIPKESIKVVPVAAAPRPAVEVIAELKQLNTEQAKIEVLEAKIRHLMGLIKSKGVEVK